MCVSRSFAASWSESGWCCARTFGVGESLLICLLGREPSCWRRVIEAFELAGCRGEALRSDIAVAVAIVAFFRECLRPFGLWGWWLSWSKTWRSEA